MGYDTSDVVKALKEIGKATPDLKTIAGVDFEKNYRIMSKDGLYTSFDHDATGSIDKSPASCRNSARGGF